MAEADNFGVFFRKVRKGLGLTLREFCHRSGFDPGNVSRIERGLTPPPKKKEGLEKYAKALKLKVGSDDYNRFLDLAAKETGRVSKTVADKLPTILRRLRAGAGHRNWVAARNLDHWADTLAARAFLPQLVRRLVHATGQSITFRSFPSGEQTQRHGFDGVVEAAGGDAFVPPGKSVWEMGVDQKPEKKAEEDFEKRRKRKLGIDKKATTFVFVTPRSWHGKQQWVDAKNKLGVWKEVRVYDSANLEEWLELAPGVDVWLARQLELRPDGLSDLDEYWDNLAAVTEPSLTPAVFLASRQQQAEELEAWFAGPPGAIALESRSPSEAVDFVVAVIRQAKAQEVVTARTVIVAEKNAWRSVCRSDTKLVLVAHPDLELDDELVAEAVRQGHHAVVPVRRAGSERVRAIELPRVYRHHLDEALRKTGMKREAAADYAEKAGGSLTVLKRLLAKVRGNGLPAWSLAGEAQALAPVLLAGGWNDQVDADRAALERLAARPYAEVAETAARWLDTADPPVRRVLSTWSLVSRDDSWVLMAHAVTPAHLHAFAEVALEVLSENDPALDLPPGERWMANVKGKALPHSSALRTGIAETLALLGSRPGRLKNGGDAAATATHVVRRLLEPTDWKRWASLSHHLPLLAEAAPDALLTAVENDLRSANPELTKLFEQDGESPLFSRSPHAGLLWALEGLAWDRSVLARVSYALARLDELLAGRKTGNSPQASLLSFYLPWYPQTTAPVDERVKILREICRRHPESGWRLLLELLPDRVWHGSPIRRPAFRDWALAWSDRVPGADYNRQANATSDFAVEFAGDDTARLKDLIEHFENLVPAAGEKLLQRLGTVDVSTVRVPDRRVLTDALRDKVATHRQFKDAEWALPEAVLDGIDKVRHHLEPDDPVLRNAWLFNPDWEVVRNLGEEKDRQELETLRRAAIKEVTAASGWDGVLALARAAKCASDLGVTVGRAGSAEDDCRVLPDLLVQEEEKLKEFALGYIWGRFQAGEWGWAEGLKTKKWPPSAVADLALQFPNEPRVWELVGKRGNEAEREYWLKSWRPLSSTEPDAVSATVKILLEHGRPFQAAFILHMARHKGRIEPGLAADVLEAGVKGPVAPSEAQRLQQRRHEVMELIQYLQVEAKGAEPSVDPGRVARIEWMYIGLLDGHPAKPDTLHGLIQTDPKFFVELLGVIFRSRKDVADEKKEPTPEEQARASNAYRLLRSWERVPGTRDGGEIDGEFLLGWTRGARALAEEQGRLEVCDSQIGEVLAHDHGTAADGAWPSVPVRDLIEEVASAELENGFEVGIYNKRGSYWKAMDEGGKQERELAKQYRDWAEACQVEWPRTAASLRRVADGYERQASREDAEIELRL